MKTTEAAHVRNLTDNFVGPADKVRELDRYLALAMDEKSDREQALDHAFANIERFNVHEAGADITVGEACVRACVVDDVLEAPALLAVLEAMIRRPTPPDVAPECADDCIVVKERDLARRECAELKEHIRSFHDGNER